jgi:hypothetical protein
LVEIKCPYCQRDSSISDAECIQSSDGEMHLNKEHAYYYQIQFQLLMCDLKYCDFVVWTLEDFFCRENCIG